MGLGATQRVFKKSSPDGSVTIYVDRRVFVDHLDETEPISGVVVVDKPSVGNKKVFAAVVATFRFGREEDEILGMTFCRELYLTHDQIWPPISKPDEAESQKEAVVSQEQSTAPDDNGTPCGSSAKETSPSTNLLKEKVVTKPGEEALSFTFTLPGGTPPSVIMQGNPKESGDSCGVRYFLRCYLGHDESDKPLQASTVDLAVRKSQYAPSPLPSGQPTATLTKDFPLTQGKVCLEASLDKKLYHHGEEIPVSVRIENNSSKTVKHIKVTVVQAADICMFSSGRWKVHVASTEKHCTMHQGSTSRHRFTFRPSLEDNRSTYGIFTQSRVTSEEDCLASSTIIPEKERSDFFGIIISYYVKVKIHLTSMTLPGEVICIVPFLLMHPDPRDETLRREVQCPCDWTPVSPCPVRDTEEKSTRFKINEKGEAVFHKMSQLRVRTVVG